MPEPGFSLTVGCMRHLLLLLLLIRVFSHLITNAVSSGSVRDWTSFVL